MAQSRNDRRLLEKRARRVLLAVKCPEHGSLPKGIKIEWVKVGSESEDAQVRLTVDPPVCCQKHDDALYGALYEVMGASRPN